MQQLTNTLSNQLDDLVGNMNRIAVNLAFSEELFHLLEQDATLSEPTEQYKNSLRIKKIMQQVNEFSYIARNLYIYTKSGAVYDFGVNPANNESASIKLDSMPWIKATYGVEQNFLLVSPHLNPWADGSATRVFSITRALSDVNQASPVAMAVIEVQQDYEKIEKIIQKYTSFFKGDISVIDQQQNTIYPYLSQNENNAPKYTILDHSNTPNIQELQHRPDEIVYTTTSDFTKWTTVMYIPKEELFSKIKFLRNLIIGLSVIIVLVSVIASMIISRRLSAPIVHLKNKVQKITLDYPMALTELKQYYVEEIDHLYHSFRHMITRLRTSHDEIVQSHMREHKAYLNALQAQINPHFIYNSLAVISTLGDDIGEPAIKKMCVQLCDMLRYTTDHSKSEVVMADEIRHVENYLNLLQARYENHLEIEIRIEPAMLQFRMPKLCLQPFVENAYFHGVNKILPPWKISITGEMDPAWGWTLQIEDNGIGMTDSDISQLEQRIAEWQSIKTIGDLGGLGITNTYIRLREFYGATFQFAVRHGRDGGTLIEITNKTVTNK